MEGKSIQKNYLYNVSYQILLVVAPLITTPYVSRILGAEGIGLASYAGSIASYFVLFAAMGIGIYGQREIACCQDSLERRSEVFWDLKALSLVTATAALALYLPFGLRQAHWEIYLLYGLNILTVAVDVTWFFQGMEAFGRIALRNFLFKIVDILYLFLAVRTKEDILAYVFHLTGLACISQISLWFYLPGYLTGPDGKKIRPFRELKTILSLFVPTIAIQVYTVMDKTMLGLITGDVWENGYYEQAVKLSKLALTLITALGTVTAPRIGYLYEKGNDGEVRRILYRSYRFVWILGIPLCLGLMLVSDHAVPWFFGDGYGPVSRLLKILPLLILAVGVSNVTGMQYLVPTKRQNLLTASVGIGAAVNFVLNCFLIPEWGALGAAIATVAAECVIAAAQLFLVRKMLPARYIFGASRNYAMAGTGMAVLLVGLKGWLLPGPLQTALMVLSGAAVYGGILWMVRDDFLLSILRGLGSKWGERSEKDV